MQRNGDSRATMVASLGASLAQVRRENQSLRTEVIGLRSQLAQLLEQAIVLANNWRHEMHLRSQAEGEVRNLRIAEVHREMGVVRVQQDDGPPS